jgi:hypothetical protein
MLIGWQTTKYGRSGIGLEMGGSISYAGINFHKPIDEEWLVKEIKRRKKLNDRKLEHNRRKAAQKRSIEYPDQLKQVENNEKWKEFTNLKPGTKMTCKGRLYSEKDEHKLMKRLLLLKWRVIMMTREK